MEQKIKEIFNTWKETGRVSNKNMEILYEIEKMYGIDFSNKITFYNVISKANFKAHSNAYSFVCSTLFNGLYNSSLNDKFINIAGNNISMLYSVDYNRVLSDLTQYNLSNSSLKPEVIVTNIIKSLRDTNNYKEFLSSLDISISEDIEEYNIANGIAIPKLINKRTEQYINKDVNEHLNNSLKKKYYVYYILTKIYNEYYYVYIGSGKLQRLKKERDEEFIREFISNIEGCDNNLYLIPVNNLTRQNAIYQEKKTIEKFKEDGYLLANIIHYDSIKGEKITHQNQLNNLLSENNTDKYKLREWKISLIKSVPLKKFDNINNVDLSDFRI